MAGLIGTAGHVDHGKTTLIKALTGIDADRLPEEKKRGLTIDIGFAFVDLPEVGRVSIVDVPGHERFLTNMLVGALGIDVALLCVAADSGVMPQTVEHFQVLELLPVDRLVVALTRSDLADQETIEFVTEQVNELIEKTRFKGSPIIPVSSTNGTGLDQLRQELAGALQSVAKSATGEWYVPIDRVFTVKGHGAVVTGTLAQGRVKEGDAAVVMPQGHEVRVRSIQVHDEPVPQSERGKRTALNVSGVKAEDLYRGQIVGAPGAVFASDVFDASVRWLQSPKHGARVRVSVGADEVIARVFVSDADESIAQFRTESTVALAKGQPLIVRKYSPPTLFGGGRVTIPQAARRRKSESATTIEAADDASAILTAVGQSKSGLPNEELCRLLGKSAQALGDTLESLKASEQLLGFAGLWMTHDQFVDLSGRYLAALAAVHDSDPTKLLQPREAPLKGTRLDWSGKPFDRILARLVETGRLRMQGTQVALAEFRVKFSDKQRAMLDRVIAEMSKNGLNVPGEQETSLALNVPRHAVEEIIKVGLAAGEFVRLDEGLFVPTTIVDQKVAEARQKFEGKRFTASELREALGTTRKYAIPFLEYLDAKGVTLRQGDQRVLA
jgi:selenocysteine-specific elongation factor